MINEMKKQRKMMRRRKHNLFKKIDEFEKLFDANVAIIVCKNGRFYVYRSTDQKSWPSSIEQIASLALS